MGSSSLAPSARWSNKALWRLVWPLLIEQLLAVTVGMVDTVMVTYVGESAVSGVSLIDSVNVLLINLFSALATGGAVVVSQYLGRGDKKKANVAGKQLVYSVTTLSLVVMTVVLVLRHGIVNLIYGHLEPEVMAHAQTYFWISAVSYPFIGIYNAGAALFRSAGNSRVSMFVALLVNLINIGGNSLFIYGFGWGVAGAAISTLISRAVAGVVLMYLLMHPSPKDISLRGLFKIEIDFEMIKRIFNIGVPNGLENSMFQIGKLMTARIISMFGTAAIAGNAIAGVLSTFGNLSGSAVSMALLTVVGQFVGAKDYDGARVYTRKLITVAYASMALVCIPMGIFARPLLGMFNLSPEAIDIAYQCLVVFCITAIFFWTPSFSLPNALRAAGDARFTMVTSVFSMWVFRIGLSYILALQLNLGVLGVWLAMVVDWIVRGIIFFIRWRGGKWQNKELIK